MEAHLQPEPDPIPVHVNVHEAKTTLSKLLERVEAGERIVICRAGKPVADLRRHDPPRPKRQFGRYREQLGHITEADLEAADEEFREIWEAAINEPLDL